MDRISPSRVSSVSPSDTGFRAISPTKQDDNLLGQMPKELFSLISAKDRDMKKYIDAPLNTIDLRWLIIIRRMISVASFGPRPKVTHYQIDPKMTRETSHVTISTIEIEKNIDYGVINYDVELRTISREKLFSMLPTIRVDIQATTAQKDAGDNVSRLDVKSVFMILKKRYIQLGLAKPIELARARTLDYLDEIVELYNDEADLPSLDAYLTMCKANAEIDIPIPYFRVNIDDALEKMTKQLNGHINLLKEAINCMC